MNPHDPPNRGSFLLSLIITLSTAHVFNTTLENTPVVMLSEAPVLSKAKGNISVNLVEILHIASLAQDDSE